MAVEGVNSANNNAGIYTAGAALIGGAGGAATGWYSKPFLKDGAPTDSFTKKINDAVDATIPQEIKEYLKPINELSTIYRIKTRSRVCKSSCRSFMS